MNGYLPPNLAGFKLVETHQTEASSAVEGKETTVEVFSAANGDQVFVLATHNIRWAVGWAPGGDATKGYFLRDPLCSGKYTEKYSPAAPFSAPGCALPQ